MGIAGGGATRRIAVGEPVVSIAVAVLASAAIYDSRARQHWVSVCAYLLIPDRVGRREAVQRVGIATCGQVLGRDAGTARIGSAGMAYEVAGTLSGKAIYEVARVMLPTNEGSLIAARGLNGILHDDQTVAGRHRTVVLIGASGNAGCRSGADNGSRIEAVLDDACELTHQTSGISLSGIDVGLAIAAGERAKVGRRGGTNDGSCVVGILRIRGDVSAFDSNTGNGGGIHASEEHGVQVCDGLQLAVEFSGEGLVLAADGRMLDSSEINRSRQTPLDVGVAQVDERGKELHGIRCAQFVPSVHHGHIAFHNGTA